MGLRERIEKGRVHWPAVDHEQRKVVLSHEEFTMLLAASIYPDTGAQVVSKAARRGIIEVI